MRLISLIALCLISCTAAAETYRAEDVVFKNNLFYDKNGDKLTGDVVKDYPNGAKFAHFKVTNGESVESELYYPNGKPKNKETKEYRIEYGPNHQIRRESRGERARGNDVRKFYTGDGRLLIEAPFKNNRLEGTVKIYAADGRLEEERPYAPVLNRIVKTNDGEKTVKMSVLHGVGKLYGANQKVIASTDYDKGAVKKITHFDTDGKELPSIVNNDIKTFDDQTCRLKDGKPFTGALIVNAVEPQVQFFEVPCRGGVIDGTVRVYLGSYGAYGRIYDNIPYKNGKKDGIAYVYAYSDLLLSGEVPYKNDKVDGMVREYFQSGELLYETPYKDNQIDGVRKVYGSAYADPTGDVLRGEFPYTKGQLNGVATLYNTLGDVQKKITYLFGKEVFTKDYDNDAGNTAKTAPVKSDTPAKSTTKADKIKTKAPQSADNTVPKTVVLQKTTDAKQVDALGKTKALENDTSTANRQNGKSAVKAEQK